MKMKAKSGKAEEDGKSLYGSRDPPKHLQVLKVAEEMQICQYEPRDMERDRREQSEL